MYKNNSTELALELICTFPDGTDESLVWRKYARDDDDVHRIGCDKERRKRIRKPDTRYKGCGTTTAGQIRGCRNARGHGLSVQHAPEEGIHHLAWQNVQQCEPSRLSRPTAHPQPGTPDHVTETTDLNTRSPHHRWRGLPVFPGAMPMAEGIL